MHHRLIALRRAEPALTVGDWAPIRASGGVLAYERSLPGRRLIVALELAGEPATFDHDGVASCRILLSTALDRDGEAVVGRIRLRADEGIVMEILA